MATLIAIPILAGLMIVQSGIISRIPLLHGTPDLLLLVIIAWALQKKVETAWQWSIIAGLLYNLVSALPFGVALIGYGLATGLALAFRRRVWQVPMLAMLVTTFLGTLVFLGVSYASLRLLGDPIPPGAAINLIAVPSVLLNLVLAAPAYALMGDLARWLYPEEIEV